MTGLLLLQTAADRLAEAQAGLDTPLGARLIGLLGLAGTADMREVVARAGAGDAAARLGFEVYVHRLRGGIATMAAAMDGLDALVFTGGVGENSAPLREHCAQGLRFLGVALDPARNQGGKGDREIGSATAAVRTLVVEAREDLEIARQVREVVAARV